VEVTNTMGATELLRKHLAEADPDLLRLGRMRELCGEKAESSTFGTCGAVVRLRSAVRAGRSDKRPGSWICSAPTSSSLVERERRLPLPLEYERLQYSSQAPLGQGERAYRKASDVSVPLPHDGPREGLTLAALLSCGTYGHGVRHARTGGRLSVRLPVGESDPPRRLDDCSPRNRHRR
jgi:hypothetical protein